MKLYIVRHGETECNVKGVYYGSLDVSITEKGRQQAAAVGDMLRNVAFDKVIISGLQRTRQTAETVLSRQICQSGEREQVSPGAPGPALNGGTETAGPEIWSIPAFNEMNFGAWEGLHYTRVRELYPKDYAAMSEDWINCPPTGGERFADFSRRVLDGWQELSGREAFRSADNILFVGHSGPIQCLICHFLGTDTSNIWHLEIQQGAYICFEIADDFPVLKGFNVKC